MAYRDYSATKDSKGDKRVNEEMGMWLSLLPPGFHRCLICNKIFKSLQALGGHQNAHRTLQIKTQLNDVHADLYVEEKGRNKKVREVKPIDDDQSCNGTDDRLPMVVSNDRNVVVNYEHLSGIDLNLNLGFGPRKKVINFFDLMPISEVKIDVVGASGDLQKASVSDGNCRGKGRNKKFTSKKRVDLNLKL